MFLNAFLENKGYLGPLDTWLAVVCGVMKSFNQLGVFVVLEDLLKGTLGWGTV